MEMAQSVRHTSDRALTAVDNSTSASSTKESLQSVLQTLWPVQRQPDLPTVQRSSMPQCAALYNQPCIAVVGNANVSYALQPEMQSCTVVKEVDVLTPSTCAHSADVWIVSQASGISIFAALASGDSNCDRQQMLANTKAMWYIAADKGSVAQVQSQDASVASIPAVYLPETLWQQQHRTRSSSPSARDMQPSALWIGVLTVLECAKAETQIHVYTAEQGSEASSLHHMAAEAELLEKLHASGLIVLHEACPGGTTCIAKSGGISHHSEAGLTAPGVKLYIHRKKRQDSSTLVYNEDEDEEEEESA